MKKVLYLVCLALVTSFVTYHTSSYLVKAKTVSKSSLQDCASGFISDPPNIYIVQHNNFFEFHAGLKCIGTGNTFCVYHWVIDYWLPGHTQGTNPKDGTWDFYANVNCGQSEVFVYNLQATFGMPNGTYHYHISGNDGNGGALLLGTTSDGSFTNP